MHFSSLLRVSGPAKPEITSSEPSMASEESFRFNSIMCQNLDPNSTFGTKIDVPGYSHAATTNTIPSESFTNPTSQKETERLRSTISDKFRKSRCAFRRSSSLSNFFTVRLWRTVVPGHDSSNTDLSKRGLRNWLQRKPHQDNKSHLEEIFTPLNFDFDVEQENFALFRQTYDIPPSTSTNNNASIFERPAKNVKSTETGFTNITAKNSQVAYFTPSLPSVGQPIPSITAFINEELADKASILAVFSPEDSHCTQVCEATQTNTIDKEISIILTLSKELEEQRPLQEEKTLILPSAQEPEDKLLDYTLKQKKQKKEKTEKKEKNTDQKEQPYPEPCSSAVSDQETLVSDSPLKSDLLSPLLEKEQKNQKKENQKKEQKKEHHLQQEQQQEQHHQEQQQLHTPTEPLAPEPFVGDALNLVEEISEELSIEDFAWPLESPLEDESAGVNIIDTAAATAGSAFSELVEEEIDTAAATAASSAAPESPLNEPEPFDWHCPPKYPDINIPRLAVKAATTTSPKPLSPKPPPVKDTRKFPLKIDEPFDWYDPSGPPVVYIPYPTANTTAKTTDSTANTAKTTAASTKTTAKIPKAAKNLKAAKNPKTVTAPKTAKTVEPAKTPKTAKNSKAPKTHRQTKAKASKAFKATQTTAVSKNTTTPKHNAAAAANTTAAKTKAAKVNTCNAAVKPIPHKPPSPPPPPVKDTKEVKKVEPFDWYCPPKYPDINTPRRAAKATSDTNTAAAKTSKAVETKPVETKKTTAAKEATEEITAAKETKTTTTDAATAAASATAWDEDWQDPRRLRCYRPQCRNADYPKCSYCSNLTHAPSRLRSLVAEESMEEDKPDQPIYIPIRPQIDKLRFLEELFSRAFYYWSEDNPVPKEEKDDDPANHWW